MKNLSTGTGLALLATAIVAYPFVNRISSVDQTAHASVPTVAVAAAATAQASLEPTIVWYGTTGDPPYMAVYRGWSDGRVELRTVQRQTTDYNGSTFSVWCNPSYPPCVGPWVVISDPAQGYAYRSDINFDERVDGADLAQLLADFGDAPRQDIRPSDCPLNLINP